MNLVPGLRWLHAQKYGLTYTMCIFIIAVRFT
ncbi:MAG: hypothetical protein KatS3mg022_1815 [Armatimonadota bacterium]|nr:MAG: hypothetical protein KatS3mg022_1815 [Armatimonadota bacterium]